VGTRAGRRVCVRPRPCVQPRLQVERRHVLVALQDTVDTQNARTPSPASPVASRWLQQVLVWGFGSFRWPMP